MATRMATLLYGSEFDGRLMPGAVRLPVPSEATSSPSLAPVRRATPALNALGGMMRGLVDVAAVWVGLALFGLGLAYTLSPLAEIFLVLTGTWLVAAGIGYAATSSEPTA